MSNWMGIEETAEAIRFEIERQEADSTLFTIEEMKSDPTSR